MSKQGPGYEEEREAKAATSAFVGYKPPTSSTTYTPNQFFDVVLPHASRGCLRLVAYLLHKTLGMSNPDGTPMYPETHATYKELIEEAGISRGALKAAIEEAIECRYIDCLRFGEPHSPGKTGFAALYSLRWDQEDRYVKDPQKFDGFYRGNGNLTSVPNDFFVYTVPNEPLALVRVVGVIARHTIGWQVQVGMRRQQVSMSFSEMMRHTGIASRSTLVIAINAAIEANHITRVSEGVFDAHSPVPTVWSLKWTDAADKRLSLPVFEPGTGKRTKIEPAKGSEIEPGRRFNNRTSDQGSVQKSNQPNGSIIEPEKRSGVEPASVQKSNREAFINRTSIEKTPLNNSPKQQQTEGAVVGGGVSLTLLISELLALGVKAEVVDELVENHSAELIRKQLDWLPQRVVTSNKAGLIVACIKRDIPLSGGVQTSEQPSPSRSFAQRFYSELSGIEGDSLAQPTASDERQASRFIEQRKLSGAEAIDKAARGFAAFVKEREKAKRNPVRMLSLAVTLYGDDFVQRESASAKVADRRSVEEARKAHQERFEGDYREFVGSLAERLESKDELVEKFEENCARKLENFRKMSPSGKAAKILTAQLQDSEERGRLLVEFAKDLGAVKVPSFWEWDKTRNVESFRAEI